MATRTYKKLAYSTPRIASISSSATPSPNCDTTDLFVITALAESAAIAAPTGTPVNGQRLLFRISDNGTEQDLTWNAIYSGDSLPAVTIVDAAIYVACVYNSAVSKWDAAVHREVTILSGTGDAPDPTGIPNGTLYLKYTA